MNLYEAMFVLDPADAAGNWEDLASHVAGLIARFGGEILYTERWPDRKFAYDIKGRRKGAYYLVYFRLAADQVSVLTRECEMSDRVLRLLVLRKGNALAEIERHNAMRSRAASGADESGEAAGDAPGVSPGDDDVAEDKVPDATEGDGSEDAIDDVPPRRRARYGTADEDANGIDSTFGAEDAGDGAQDDEDTDAPDDVKEQPPGD